LAVYCYGVASTVGLMSIHVLGFSDEAAIPYAVVMGVAMQLTNILRDVREDWEAGRLYLAAGGAGRLRPGRGGRRRGAMRTRAGAPSWRSRSSALAGSTMRRCGHRPDRPGRKAVDRRRGRDIPGILDDIEAHDGDVFAHRQG